MADVGVESVAAELSDFEARTQEARQRAAIIALIDEFHDKFQWCFGPIATEEYDVIALLFAARVSRILTGKTVPGTP